ncbi:hypothetical protein H0H93_008346 [Arthromyces matolae]|nr:hypothetical protein H0H93_008346 [Arthromyces matolae]
MRPPHTPHELPAFPVYSSSFLSENELVLGGGGGTAKAGIKNRLRVFNVGPQRSLDQIGEVELEVGEDAPMSMVANREARSIVCGINSSEKSMEKGINEHCRVFTLDENTPVLSKTRGTIPTTDPSDYQKVTVLSPDGTLLAVAGAHDIAFLHYPSLHPFAESIHTENEIYDATFSGSTITVVTTANLTIYSLPKTSVEPSTPSVKINKVKGKGKSAKVASNTATPKLEVLQTVAVPPIPGALPTFRSARYHPTNDQIIYATVNATTPRTKKTKTPQRQSFVYKWNTTTWTVERSRKVGDRALTKLKLFYLSPDGKFLGYGTSDLTVGLLDATNLSPLAGILKAHDFPPTTIAFNPTSTLLISGSADASVRVVSIPGTIASGSWTLTVLILLAIIVALLAFAARDYL